MKAAAYSSWVYRPESSLVSGLQALGMLALVAWVLLFSFENLRPLRRAAAAALAVIHAAYLVAYSRAYDMSVRVLPLFDYLYDSQGHQSLMLDMSQLALLYLAVSKLREARRRRQARSETDITPTEPPSPTSRSGGGETRPDTAA